MATKVNELTDTLTRTCRELVSSLVLDPQTQILDVHVKTVRTTRFDSPKERTCYIVQIDTNDSSMVAGAVDAFKGSYKERLEGALQAALRDSDGEAEVAVDIIGPSGPAVEKLLPLADLEVSCKLSHDAPISAVAREFGIPYILIRGRHWIGPNPALAKVLLSVLRKDATPQTVLDLFAGTGIVTKVVLQLSPSPLITTVDSDENKTEAMHHHTQSNRVSIITADAFTIPINQHFDLIVADPYYEACVSFLKARGREVRSRARTFVVTGGRIEHESWNERIRRLLSGQGFRVRSETLYGQTLFVCT